MLLATQGIIGSRFLQDALQGDLFKTIMADRDFYHISSRENMFISENLCNKNDAPSQY